MSGFWKRTSLCAGAPALAVGSAAPLFAQTPPAGAPAAPATMPAADAPIATIDGRDINNAAFYHLMMQIAGMRVFQQVFDLTVVQRACQLGGVPIEGPDFDTRIKAEYQRTLDSLNLPSTTKEEDRAKVLDEVLRRQGVTAIEFRMGLERQAGLRALAKGKVDVTPKDIDDAYNAKYGEKVTIRLFNVGSTDKAAALRAAVEGEKKTPEAAAQAVGLQPPQSLTISRNATGIDALKEVAFAKNERELSAPVTFNNQMFMVLVEKKEASQTAKVTQASVEADLKKDVLNFKETQWMNQHLANLRAQAAVKINDPVLSQQFAAIADALKKQADAAASATQPASAPAAPR